MKSGKELRERMEELKHILVHDEDQLTEEETAELAELRSLFENGLEDSNMLLDVDDESAQAAWAEEYVTENESISDLVRNNVNWAAVASDLLHDKDQIVYDGKSYYVL